MADARLRIGKSRSKPFQDRCLYYMYDKAAAIFAESSPDADDLLLAKALWAGQVKTEDMARIVTTNATIGSAIDADTAVTESDIEYAIVSGGSFHELALSYKAAGLIGT